MIACRYVVLTDAFSEEVGLQQVLENVGVGATGTLKGVNLESCDLYTVLIYRTFFLV